MLLLRNSYANAKKSLAGSADNDQAKTVNVYGSFTMPRFGQLDLNSKHLLYYQRGGNVCTDSGSE